MTIVSISQLKTNPDSVISLARSHPVAIKNDNKIEAYLLGKNFSKDLAEFMENKIDVKTI